MALYTIIFSPTGGTQKCAKALAEGIGSIDARIDLASRDLQPVKLTSGDIAVIAVPSFSGRVPALAIERLKKVQGNVAKAVLLAVYGNRAFEDTLIELSDAAEACGFEVVAGVAAVARHSIVNKIATERPDVSDFQTLMEFGQGIKAKIVEGTAAKVEIPGNRPYRKAGKGIVPKTKSNCNECGKCVVMCPSGAISADDPRKIDKDVCVNCMRCVEVCPNRSKYVSPLMLWLVGQVLKKPCADRKEPELFM